MAVYYLDSSVCIDFLRGRLGAGYRVLRNADRSSFKIPAVVVAELYTSAQLCSNPTKQMKRVEDFVKVFDVVPFDADCAQEYCHIRTRLEQEGRHGRIIGERSMMIAATACAHRATLVTSDDRRYLRVPDLMMELWEDER